MSESYPIPSRANTVIVSLQLLALIICFKTLSHVQSTPALLLLALCFGLVMNSVYSTIHEAHHRMLFSDRRMNDGCGIFLSLFFPAPFHLLRQGHIGHHRKNRSDDEVFDLYFDRDSKLCKYAMWYGILTGIYWIAIVILNFVLVLAPGLMKPSLYKWDKTSEIFLNHFDPKSFPVLRLEALGVILFQCALFWWVDVTWSHYFIMYFGFGLMWSSLQYVHHYNTDRDVIDGARNLHLWRPIDFIWLNHNWHHTHHQRPTVPWRYLPELAERAKTPTGWLIPAYIQMWNGPKRAVAGLKNRFEGKVSN